MNKAFQHRLKALRERAGLDQGQMAEALKVGRSYYNGLETGRNSNPSERLVQQVNMIEQAGVHLLGSLSPGSQIQSQKLSPAPGSEHATRRLITPTDAPTSTVVAPRYSPEKRQPSTRVECEVYFRAILDAAEASENPNAYPVIHDRLVKKFPLDEWLPE